MGTAKRASLAISHAIAELLDITGMLYWASAMAIIVAHFSDVQEMKIASSGMVALLMIASIASNIDCG